jgi:tyrosyl-tRNA synthetase
VKNLNSEIKQVLERGVDKILPSKDGLASLMAKRKIRLYNGIDPTGSKLHLGHTVSLRKLQEFADLGHESILVIGTGTVLAGDPSLRDEARPQISQEEIENNIKTWKEQAGKVLDFSRVKVRYNGEWLLKLGLKEIINIAAHISAVKLFQREMFQRRIKKGGTVWMSEALYPLLQGYDSVALDTDLEIGGTDQVFNMLIGRELQAKMRQREKFVMTLPMILGIDGKTMSKTSGNCVWLDDSADQMFGKIMSMPDTIVPDYFKILTRVPLEEIKELSPLESKTRLASEIVVLYHGKKEALRAAEEFSRVFKEKGLPSDIPEIFVKEKEINILDLLIKIKMTSSRAEARRLVEQGGVAIDGEIQKNWRKIVKIKKGEVIRVGKRKFAKII